MIQTRKKWQKKKNEKKLRKMQKMMRDTHYTIITSFTGESHKGNANHSHTDTQTVSQLFFFFLFFKIIISVIFLLVDSDVEMRRAEPIAIVVRKNRGKNQEPANTAVVRIHTCGPRAKFACAS